MQLSKYCKIYHNREEPGLITLFSTSTTAVVEVAPDVIDDIKKGSLKGRERKTLISEGFLVRSSREERQEMLRYVDDLNAENTTLTAIVVLNLDCNLACRYCFEGQRKGKYILSEEIAGKFADYVRSRVRAGRDEINIIFYGGEPLLSVAMLSRISEEMGSLARAQKLGYSFSLITNGTLLTPRVVERLKPLGLKSASVTLDGPRDVHDSFRPFKTGKGSFDTIVSNIREVCRMTDVQVGGNYTHDSYRQFPELLDYFLDHGLTPDRISYVKFDPILNESGEFAPDFHDGCVSANEPWLVEAGIFLREEILKRGFRTQEIVPAVCMMELSDNVVVNYDGTLYKCPGLIGRKEFSSGTLETGEDDCGMVHGAGAWKNEECLVCSYLPLCFGGCRYSKLVREGHMRGVDCKKPYFDKALQALVHQEVRYQTNS